MAYADLTATEKTELQEWLLVLRPWCGVQARANTQGGAVDEAYNSHVSTILGELVGSDEIPNTSGMQGATSLTKDEVISIVSHIQGIRTNYNTSGHRQLWTQAAGAINMVG